MNTNIIADKLNSFGHNLITTTVTSVSISSQPEINHNAAETQFSMSILKIAAIITIIIMVVGISGNLLTIIALTKCSKVRNVATAFIISLCVADFLFCIAVLPFNIHRFFNGNSYGGEILCKLVPFIQYGNIGVSLLCITMITINRYIMIAHGVYSKVYKAHWILLMIAFCWLFSYGMQLPTLFGIWGKFGYDKKLGSCSIVQDDYKRSSKTALFIIAFVIPCVIIIACYSRIFIIVYRSEARMRQHATKQNSIPNNLRQICTPVNECRSSISNQSSADTPSNNIQSKNLSQKSSRIVDQREIKVKRNEWRITKMVLAIFLSFILCYLPITIIKTADSDVNYPGFHIFGYIMLYLSSCVNPIIYVIMNKQYRQAYKTILLCKSYRIGIYTQNGSSLGEMERRRIQLQSQSYYGIGSFGGREPIPLPQFSGPQRFIENNKLTTSNGNDFTKSL